jgi:YkoY family integral membrane protein
MLHQTFDLIDLPRLFALSLIEIILSADNAIILGLLVHALPTRLRRKALLIGVSSAFLLRAVAVFAVSFILSSLYLELFGAAYLFYLALTHFFRKLKRHRPSAPPSFWKTVFLIEAFDLAFALDSIIAGIAFIATTPTTHIHPKLWVVYAGGMIGLIVIRYAAEFFARLINRFPRLNDTAYLLIGLIAIKLTLEVLAPTLPHLQLGFWVLFTAIFASSFWKRQSELD